MNLVAVQAHMKLKDYESAEAFRQKIFALSEKATNGLPAGDTLLAFPETIGLPLLFTLGRFDKVKDLPSVRAIMLSYIKSSWQDVLKTAFKHNAFALNALYLPQSINAYLAYKNTFSEAARTFAVSIVAGSSFLPLLEEEASRGVHVANARVFNTSFGFAPTGTVLGRTKKLYLTQGAESSAGLSRGRLEDLSLMLMPVGRVGVAICLDAFYASVIEQFDGLGAEIIVQPSANHAAWDRPWPPDKNLTEGEAWLNYGLAKQVQNRQNIHYGLNPMMVGKLWDLDAYGRSAIVANISKTKHKDAFLALAESATEEEIIWARV